MKTLRVNLTLIISGYPLTTPFTCDVNMLCVNSFISAVFGDIFQEQNTKVWWLQKRWITNISITTTCVYRNDCVQPLKQAPWETEWGVFGSACDVNSELTRFFFLNRCVEIANNMWLYLSEWVVVFKLQLHKRVSLVVLNVDFKLPVQNRVKWSQCLWILCSELKFN